MMKKDNDVASPEDNIVDSVSQDVHKVIWLKSDHTWTIIYYICSVLTVGILNIVCFFRPIDRHWLCSVICEPTEADHAIISLIASSPVQTASATVSKSSSTTSFTKDNIEKQSTQKKESLDSSKDIPLEINHYIVTVQRYENANEIIISLEANCQRFCASSYDNYQLLKVPMVPKNFKRFLIPHDEMTGDIKQRKEERNLLNAQYGYNKMYIPEISALEILIKTALHPFFLFQYFAVTIWIIEDYIAYSVLILVITFGAIYITTSESIFNLERLRTLAGMEGTSQVLEIDNYKKEGDYNYYSAPDGILLPGDRFLVVEGSVMPCDSVLVSGRVVVDESMLTGESIPVAKVTVELKGLGGKSKFSTITKGSLKETATNSLNDRLQKLDSRGEDEDGPEIDIAAKRSGSVLFGGTKVKACYGGECIAVVYRTGFRSGKGQLVSSLLNPKEGFLSFFADALWVILFMLLLTTALYIYVALTLKNMGATDDEIALRYFDAITIAVPPGLTASLAIATAISIGRLKEYNIYVSDTSRVNWAGTISAACFDKTGTLTEENMNFQGASISSKVLTASEDAKAHELYLVDRGPDISDLPSICIELMATCQSLSIVDGQSAPSGDPLEVELFRATGWVLEMSSDISGKMIAKSPLKEIFQIVRHFEFTPERLRAATLLRRPDDTLVYLVKGSPERIVQLCKQTTVPSSLNSTLMQLARKGLRVIAMAYKECIESAEILENIPQDELEAKGDINFLGLLFLSSKLKDETKSTIRSLKNADIPTNMITGDHIHTAIAIATECGILVPVSPRYNTLYIIDEDENTGATKIVESLTENKINMKMETLMNFAAESSMKYDTTLVEEHDNIAVATFANTNSSYNNIEDQAAISDVEGASTSKGQIQIAITGRGLISVRRNYPSSIVTDIVRYCRVFARTKPADKKYVVERLLKTKEMDDRLISLIKGEVRRASFRQSFASTSSNPMIRTASQDGFDDSNALGDRYGENEDRGEFHVLFCGDGANDMAALRAATVGVSLCDAETSVAAPITSRSQTPGSVIQVLREGRCSLVTAYVLVLFNIMYGVIQLFMCCELYQYGLVAGLYMYLIQDLFYTLVLGLAIAFNAPSDSLHCELPPKRFFNSYFMFKLFSQVVCFIAFQIGALVLLSEQSWYVPYVTDDPLTDTYSYEATTISNIALGQLMIASIVSTIGEPFRKPWFLNWWHVIALIFQAGWLMFQLFSGDNYVTREILEQEPLPTDFALMLVGYLFLNAFASLILDYIAYLLRPPSRKSRYRALLQGANLPGMFTSDDSSPMSPKHGIVDNSSEKLNHHEVKPLISSVDF